jgi:hypothetical protein
MSGAQRRSVAAGTRVADKVLQTFDYACLMDDRDTAAALLIVLEDMADRTARRFGGDRRLSGIDLGEARARLQAMKANPWASRPAGGQPAQ